MSKMGRPRTYDKAEDLEKACEAYLSSTEEPTMAGLCISVGMSNQSWSDYGLGRYDSETENFSVIVNRARKAVEAVVEARLVYGSNVTGPLFWLKNHSNYKDQRELGGLGGGGINIIMSEEDAAIL